MDEVCWRTYDHREWHVFARGATRCDCGGAHIKVRDEPTVPTRAHAATVRLEYDKPDDEVS